MKKKKARIKADFKSHSLGPHAWYYREKKYFDVYVHAEAGNIINFRIYYSKALKP